MIPLLAVAGIALVAGVALSAFWTTIRDFIKDSVEKIKTVLIPALIVGFRTYLETGSYVAAATKAMQKFYSKNQEGKWQETIVTRIVSENEIPADILKKAKNSQSPLDITEQVQQELHLEI